MLITDSLNKLVTLMTKYISKREEFYRRTKCCENDTFEFEKFEVVLVGLRYIEVISLPEGSIDNYDPQVYPLKDFKKSSSRFALEMQSKGLVSQFIIDQLELQLLAHL